MCGLCGVIDPDRHWGGGISDASNPAPYRRRHERLRLAALATAFLRPARIEVEDFGGLSFVVRSATGATEVVTGLPEIWRAAERLSGRRIDPLAPPYLRDDCA